MCMRWLYAQLRRCIGMVCRCPAVQRCFGMGWWSATTGVDCFNSWLARKQLLHVAANYGSELDCRVLWLSGCLCHNTGSCVHGHVRAYNHAIYQLACRCVLNILHESSYRLITRI